MMDSDLLLMIGTDFPYQPFFPKDATIVQIDIHGEQLGRRANVTTALWEIRSRRSGLCCRN